MSEKLYGRYTAGQWANEPFVTSPAVTTMARDLLLAQRECQRWAQWAADVSGADVRLSNDELMDQVSIKVCNQRTLIAELDVDLAASEATIARGRALVPQWREYALALEHTPFTDIERAADELEAALKGGLAFSDDATAAVAELKSRLKGGTSCE